MSRFKYPRTCHFPFSEGATDDDKILTSTDHFKGQIVVVTEKMDGENTTIYSDHCHARSIDSKHKPYHSWLLSYISSFQHQIPDDWRICGEYLYAKHSIGYDNLPSYLMVFSIWDETNTCLSWDDTVELCVDLGLEHVPVIYKGEYDEELIKKLAENGQIVVALIDDEATVKTFYKENGHFRLQPENPTMDPIIVESLSILGRVVGSIRSYE